MPGKFATDSNRNVIRFFMGKLGSAKIIDAAATSLEIKKTFTKNNNAFDIMACVRYLCL